MCEWMDVTEVDNFYRMFNKIGTDLLKVFITHRGVLNIQHIEVRL